MEGFVKLFQSSSLLTCALLMAAAGASGLRQANAEQPIPPAISSAMGQDNSTPASASGAWGMTWTDKNGDAKEGTLQIQQSGNQLSGKFSGQRGMFPLSGTLQGGQVSITVKAYGRKISFAGTLDGDKMSGTTEAGKPWNATRQ
jgi:hypothetical protein